MKAMTVARVVLVTTLLAAGVAQAQPAAPSNQAAAWSEGSRLIERGVSAMDSANKAQADAARRGVDALGRRTAAVTNGLRASEEFRRVASAAPNSPDAAEAQRWAALVQAAAAKWQGFQSQEIVATRDLNAAIQQNANAQKALEGALIQLDQGRRMLADLQPVSAELSTGAAPQVSAPAAPAPVR